MPFGFSSITYVTYLRMLFLPQLDCSSTEDRLTQWLQWWDSFLPALCWAEQLSCVCGPVRFGSSRKAAGIFSTPGSMSTYRKWTRTLTLPIALSWDSCYTVDHTSAPRGWLLAIHSAQRGRRNPTTPFFLQECEGMWTLADGDLRTCVIMTEHPTGDAGWSHLDGSVLMRWVPCECQQGHEGLATRT